MKTQQHKFLLKKYVYATNAEQALKLDKKTPVRDVILQEEKQEPIQTEAIGFELE